MGKRIDQLDSIRGIASLFVLFNHLYLVTAIPVISLIFSKYSPLGVIVNGSAAVIMFFVLSGFVLTLPFLKNKGVLYGNYLVRRVFRIYVPYLISIFISIVLCGLLSSGSGIPELSEWFNRSWNDPISLKTVVEHFLLIGNYNSNSFNNVLWSLIHEMRISIIFPFMALMIVRVNWKFNLAVCIFLSLISGLNNVFGWEVSYGFTTAFSDTIHYMAVFLIGGLVAKHRDDLIAYYLKFPRSAKLLILAAAFVLYDFSGVLKVTADNLGLSPFSGILKDYVTTVGASLFIVVSIGSISISKILMRKPIRFLGEISYSLYLYHLTILLSLVHLLHGVVPLFVIYCMTFILAFIAAKLSHQFIELPAISIGKRLTSGGNRRVATSEKPTLTV